ncbi:MAG: ABC transporter ATP-binding protein [Sphaerochaeta sp.]|nr:ABC transporter ATP-binding protein [Sphaerochaeta sp.]
MSYLEIKGVDKAYGVHGPKVIENLNLTIERGEFMVFLGPSGCGKTTIIRMIAGLEEVSKGDIRIDGVSILDKLPKDRGVSMIFQSYAIWPHMTVFDNIAYPLKLQKLPKSEIKKRVQQAAEVTQIDGLLDRYPNNMSGGQRQRVAVSRALVIDPKIFLMDEPLSNLDAKLRVSMRTELREIHDTIKATSIFVTHDQSEAMSLADRIVIINRGKIEQIGTPVEVYQKSATKFVASFIGTPPTNFLKAVITEEGERLLAIGDGFSLPVAAIHQDALSPYVQKEVDVGIRPEKIGLAKEKDVHAAVIAKVKINHIEQQGSHAILITHIGAQQIKLETSEFMEIQVKQELYAYVLDESVAYFDPETEQRIV